MILNLICVIAYFLGVFWYLHELDKAVKFNPRYASGREKHPNYVTSCIIIFSLLWPLSVIMDMVIYIIAVIVVITRRKP